MPAINPSVIELPLWPDEPPLAYAQDAAELTTERPIPPDWSGLNRSVEFVSVPSLVVHRPDEPNGCAMLVLPGGGYRYLEIDKEGHHIAARLASEGITAAVLKYRTCPPSARIARQPMPGHIMAAILGDALRAMRLMRHCAVEWGYDPSKVGAIGFSAGAGLAARLATQYSTPDLLGDAVGEESARPSYVGLVYPGIRDDTLGLVDADTPPVFLCDVDDDTQTPPENCIRYYGACRAAGVSAEMHIYRRGRHGFGLGRADQPVATWMERFLAWLGDLGMI